MPNEVKDELDAAWQALIEKDDRTSPEEYPDMVLITKDELRDLLALRPQREDAGAGGGVDDEALEAEVDATIDEIAEASFALGDNGWIARLAARVTAHRLLSAAPQPSAPEGLREAAIREVEAYLRKRANIEHTSGSIYPTTASRSTIYNAVADELVGRFVEAFSPSPPTGRDATEEGWVEWKGRGRPVFDDDRVFIRNRNGDEFAVIAGGVRWIHTGVHTDIIAYRLAAPKPETAQKGGKS